MVKKGIPTENGWDTQVQMNIKVVLATEMLFTYIIKLGEDGLEVFVSFNPLDQVISFTLLFDHSSSLVWQDPNLFVALLPIGTVSEIAIDIFFKNSC